MATVVNTLFPPVIPTFMNAFPNTTDAVVYFSLSPFNSSTEIKHVHVSVVNQLNNENAIATKHPSGVLFSDLNYDTKAGMYYITIPVTDIDGNVFNINQFYKVQLRFDSCNWDNIDGNDVPNSEKKVTNYLLNYQQYFSEWSSVCLIRPILQPSIFIKTFEIYQEAAGSSKVPSYNKGIIPIVGNMSFGDGSQNETETMQSYQIQILSENGKEVLQTYPTIYTGDNLDPNVINYKIDLQKLDTTDSSQFKLEITGITRNQYTCTKIYDFQISNFLEEEKFNPILKVEMDNENGIAKVHVTNKSEQTLFGTVYIKRSSSLDNFKTVENIYATKIAGNLDITFEDNTVSSLVWYQYSAQFENSAGAFTPVKNSQVFLPEFYDAILSRGEKQYNIKYNYTVSNMKPVVNRAKIDTLGGRYPKFAENAILNYKQFSIKGMISAEADAYQKFLEKKEVYSGNLNNYYSVYKENNGIKDLARNDFQKWIKDTVQDYPENNIVGDTNYRFLTTTENDWMWEREFREELVEWLNDGEPKLYRSMPEGSMVVMLTDVNLTPMQGRSRLNWDFTATVYEIAEADSLELLDSLGIYETVKLPEVTQGSGGGSVDPEPEYVEVVKVGQLFQYEITDKSDIRNMLLQELQKKYGKRDSEKESWDEGNVLSDKKPDELYLKNVKIFFHNKPNLYYTDSAGNLQWVYDNKYDPRIHGDKQIFTGYSFNMITSASEGEINIFVNDRGYYQIPNDLDVKSLSFNRPGDVVTIEYTMVYKEKNNISNTIAGNTISRTIIGQYEGIFQPNQYLGEKIRSKYNFVKTGDYSERMQYWKGICLDTVPYALCGIEYVGGDGEQTYEIGHTGVLHMLKQFSVKDIRFFGRRMVRQDISRQRFLEDWEYVIDSSVSEETLGRYMNWFNLDNEDTKKRVSIYQDDELSEKIVPSWQVINPNNPKSEHITYNTVDEIENPQRNTVYDIGGSLKIYYHDHWYNFKNLARDTTELVSNNAIQEIGLAVAPIEGQVNYYGTVVQSTYA